jgi:hypothetical protein
MLLELCVLGTPDLPTSGWGESGLPLGAVHNICFCLLLVMGHLGGILGWGLVSIMPKVSAIDVLRRFVTINHWLSSTNKERGYSMSFEVGTRVNFRS